MKNEIWKDIPGYEGLYSVSDMGRVKSLERVVTRKNRHGGISEYRVREKIRRLPVDAYGYPTVTLCSENGKLSAKVHQLVLLAFEGPLPDGMVTRHLNSIKTDNRRRNLRYGTHKENAQDAREAGTAVRGSTHGCAKLAEKDVLEIRRRYAKGEMGVDLARVFGVSKATVSLITLRKSWKHI